ncbi:MAG: hypothetical protein V3S38_06340 [Acidimicrobiia bacterium]
MMNKTKALVASVAIGAVALTGCSSDGTLLETVSPEETNEIILDIRTIAVWR